MSACRSAVTVRDTSAGTSSSRRALVPKAHANPVQAATKLALLFDPSRAVVCLRSVHHAEGCCRSGGLPTLRGGWMHISTVPLSCFLPQLEPTPGFIGWDNTLSKVHFSNQHQPLQTQKAMAPVRVSRSLYPGFLSLFLFYDHDNSITHAQSPDNTSAWPFFRIKNCVFGTVYVLLRFHNAASFASVKGVPVTSTEECCCVCFDCYCHVQCDVCIGV